TRLRKAVGRAGQPTYADWARRANRRLAIAAQVGATGRVRNRIPASAGVRSPLRWLQRWQAATVLVQVFPPPRARGTMWSTLVAGAPQAPHGRPPRTRPPEPDQDGPGVCRHLVST